MDLFQYEYYNLKEIVRKNTNDRQYFHFESTLRLINKDFKVQWIRNYMKDKKITE